MSYVYHLHRFSRNLGVVINVLVYFFHPGANWQDFLNSSDSPQERRKEEAASSERLDPVTKNESLWH